MADKKRVNLTVDAETKKEWKTAAEDSTEYKNLSHLIRVAVSRELSESAGAAPAPKGRNNQPEQSEPQSAVQAEALEEVTDTLTDIESTLSNLDSRLGNVEQEVTATSRTELKNQIFEALPKYRTGEELDEEYDADGKSAAEIAEELDTNRERIGEIIRRLQEQSGIIREVAVINGEQFWARKDEQ